MPNIDLQRRFIDDVGPRVSRQLGEALVDVHIEAIFQTVDIDGIRAGVEGQPEALFTLAQRPFGLLALGDIYRDRQDHRLSFQHDVAEMYLSRILGAIFSNVGGLQGDGFPLI